MRIEQTVSIIPDDRQIVSSQVRRRNAFALLLFLCAAGAFLLRAIISPQMMNMVVPYSTEGGFLPVKIHIGTYAIFLLLAVILVTRPIRLEGNDVRLFKATLGYTVFLSLLLPYLFVTGRAGSAGFIVDSYLVACAAAMVMLCLDGQSQRALGDAIIAMAILGAIIGTIEAFTQHRFLPYPLRELEFRPTGLSSHPLALGALCTTAIGFVSLTCWRIWVRLLGILVLFVGVAVSGARAALLLAIGEILFLLVFVPWPGLSPGHQRQAKSIVMVLTLVSGGALIAALFSMGLLNRFGNTLFDQNYFARVRIYDVFQFVSWKDVLLGMSPDDLLRIVNEKLDLPYIESTPVALTLLFGLPITLAFASVFFRFVFQFTRSTPRAAHIATLVFLFVALSNNALSSKAPDIMLLVILLLAYRNPATDLLSSSWQPSTGAVDHFDPAGTIQRMDTLSSPGRPGQDRTRG